MHNEILTDEAKRLKAFIGHIKLTHKEFAEEFDKTQSNVTKYCNGQLRIPIELLKRIHMKYNLNFNWFFTGTGPMVVHSPEKRTLINDIGFMIASQAAMEAKILAMDKVIKKLTRDIYANKHGVS